MTQVPAAANSLESMRRLLTGPLCGWPEDRVTVISNREAPGDLPDTLVQLLAEAEDAALFYYVGHGRVDFEDQLCLGLAGSRNQSERLATTSLTFDAVRRAMRVSHAATKVIILDCCFAGHAVHTRHTLSGGKDADITGLVGASGAYTLAATGPASTAWFETDADSPLPHTHFTRALIETVNRGIPGAPAALTLEPVYRRVRQVLQTSGKPAPTRNSRDLAGDFIFARNIAPPPAPESPSAPERGHDLARAAQLLDTAEDAAHAIPGPAAQCRALIHIARTMSATAEMTHRVRGLLDDAERITRTLPDPEDQAACWGELASATVADDPARARGFLGAYENVVNSNQVLRDTWDSEIAYGPTWPALLRLDPDRTERLARAMPDYLRDSFMARAAEAVAVRDPGRAVRLASAVLDANVRDQALSAVVGVIADDAPDSAERIARGITHPSFQSMALASVAAVTGPRDPQHGHTLLRDAEAAARKAPDDSRPADYNLMYVVFALCSRSWLERVRQSPSGISWLREHSSRITDEITLPRYSAESAVATARTMLPDKPAEARRLLDFAVYRYSEIGAGKDEATQHWDKRQNAHILRDAALAMLPVDQERALHIAARVPLNPFFLRDQVYVRLVPALAPHATDIAEALAYGIVQLDQRAPALAIIARALAPNDPSEAAVMLEQARRVARAAGRKRDRTVVEVAAVVAAYSPELAVTVLNEDTLSDDRSEGLARIAKATAETRPDEAETIARTIPDPHHRSWALTHLAAVCAHGAAAQGT